MRFLTVLFLGACIASGADSPAAETKSGIVAEAQVQDWLRMWQNRLHLDDWKVTLRIVHSSELKPNTLGNLKWNHTDHTAVMKVLNPEDYELPAADIPEDMEYTVVHELIHLQLSVLPRDLQMKDVEESVVNKIADALMAMQRGPTFHARSVPAPKRTIPATDPAAAGRSVQ